MSESQPEGSDGLLEGPEGLPEGLEGLPGGSQGPSGGLGRMDGRIEFLPILQEIFPYWGRCPKKKRFPIE